LTQRLRKVVREKQKKRNKCATGGTKRGIRPCRKKRDGVHGPPSLRSWWKRQEASTGKALVAKQANPTTRRRKREHKHAVRWCSLGKSLKTVRGKVVQKMKKSDREMKALGKNYWNGCQSGRKKRGAKPLK